MGRFKKKVIIESEVTKKMFYDYINATGCQKIFLSSIYNPETLNIFSDASTIKKNNITYGCFGAVCVVGDEIIDSKYVVFEKTTSNACEVHGVLLAFDFAFKYMKQFKFINIFSDSLYSVKGFREYIYGWRYHKHKLYRTPSKKHPVEHQEVFVEGFDMWQRMLLVNPNIRLFHQKGHVGTESPNSVIDAANKFAEFNNYYGSIDLNFIRYISNYNNFVDNMTRQYLKRYDSDKYYIDPIKFFPTHPY